ncbi:MAG: sigma 54-interacting transcriptional regulator [Deltaproteobacteria bacterium]|nr:sigma 54-interacting transcriptional regulator [Deltaproteobacteria bacterium]
MTATKPTFPPRYEPLERLGQGGGGEVWSARDRVTGKLVALKLLREGADDAEVMALVREATALSGIEGLGVPRVLQFGRLPGSGRTYLARELVEGSSLAEQIESKADPRSCIAALIDAAELLTSLHRARLLHGDVKPANIIVGRDGRATLVDLGLAAPWREGGARPEGLTPQFAAPELFRGEALTPQAEVYALGASLEQILATGAARLPTRQLSAAKAVVRRAMAARASERYPSVDEFAEALRTAVQLDGVHSDRAGGAEARDSRVRRVWTIVGGDETAAELLGRVAAMGAGDGLLLGGPAGAGRTTLLRRLSWSLGVGGHVVTLVDGSERDALAIALESHTADQGSGGLFVLVDDADALPPEDFARIDALRATGARLVAVVGGRHGSEALSSSRTFAWFEVPPLGEDDALGLVGRFMPSLSHELRRQLVTRSAGYPGPLRQLVERLGSTAVVSLDDLDVALADAPVPEGLRIALGEIHRLLDRGRLDKADEYLAAYGDEPSISLAVARAKVAIGRGAPKVALEVLHRSEELLPECGREEGVAWNVQKARAHNRAGEYELAELHANRALVLLGVSLGTSLDELLKAGAWALSVDALAVAGVAQSMSGRHERAVEILARCVDLARHSNDPRLLALALGSIAFAHQRGERLVDAEDAHAEALTYAEQAGDAGQVATTRLNLATIAHKRGDFASTLTHLEAAVDMGRRSGRIATVRQALFNLASLDLYLGRVARAQASLDTLAADRESLSATAQAQLLALEAESSDLAGDAELALDKCTACAEAYQRLGRRSDAAEALFEHVLIAARQLSADTVALHDEMLAAEALLGDSGAHEPLRLHTRGRVAVREGRLGDARTHFDQAIEVAERRGQRDWVWRSLVARAELAAFEQRGADEATDRRRALAIVESIASTLPMDLREVFWSDPRRRPLKEAPPRGGRLPLSRPSAVVASGFSGRHDTDVSAATQLGAPPQSSYGLAPALARPDRLALLLEINRELAGEYDLERLLARVTDRAVQLLDAERGFVLLRSRADEQRLSVHAMNHRVGEEPHAVFSRSIAERVLTSGEPFLAVDAPSDERVSDYVSVHQLMLKSVVCVPIRGRSGRTMGALYLESRVCPVSPFAEELPSLGALAEQTAIAIETARLITENRERAEALEAANRELATARDKLEEVLGRRTEQLEETKRSLRTVKAALLGHFGYGGIVGMSSAMRRVYAVIERVKEADVPVLITGESGTGKEVVARTIHTMGGRAKQKFVGINCGAIPEHLLEGELFGHVRGAFTGADRDKKGLFREIDGGTILLDEIGEMPAKMQAGLLRVLQEKVVRPVGGTREEPVDVRVIAATHRNLAEMVQRGAFREDLFYRLNVIEVRTPALRERSDDIPLLVDHFLRIFAARYGRERRSVSRDALRLLQAYPWPGNVRQLENVLLNAWILSDDDEIAAVDLELPQVVTGERRPPSPSGSSPHGNERRPEREAARPETREEYDEVERAQILSALENAAWNRAEAARDLGMPRRTFYRRLKRYGIQ